MLVLKVWAVLLAPADRWVVVSSEEGDAGPRPTDLRTRRRTGVRPASDPSRTRVGPGSDRGRTNRRTQHRDWAACGAHLTRPRWAQKGVLWGEGCNSPPIWDQTLSSSAFRVLFESGSRHAMSQPLTDLARALADAARTINSPRTVEETLDAIVHAAQASVPGFDQAGISVVHGRDKIETKAATSQLVWELDDLQYTLMEGPCVSALLEKPVVSAPNLRHDQRWPHYVPRAVEYGVRSQLGYRLYADDHTLGLLNFYSTESDALHDGACEIGELFATHATVALGRAIEEDNLNLALTTRGLIGQAVGLTMSRFQIPSDRAFQFLVRASSTSNIKVRDLAAAVVDEANAAYQNGTPST
jgi:hypothetical protein